MTTSLVLCCVVLGQALPELPTIPVPTSARREAEAASGEGKIFGEPTPADPAHAPISNPAEEFAPLELPNRFEMADSALIEPTPSEPAPAEPSFIQPVAASSTLIGAPLTLPQRTGNEGLAKKLLDVAYPKELDPAAQKASLPLRDLLQPSPDRPRQLTAIRTYWEASVLLADWRYANWEMEAVNQLQAPRDAVAQASLTAMQAAAHARVVDAEMAAMNARLALAEAVPATSLSDPPLPADAPFAGRYNTQYDKLFASKATPVGLKRIHEILPLRYNLVEARATAVVASEEALDGQISSYRSGRASLADVQFALDRLRQQRGAFLGAVRDYNFDIAEYALAAGGAEAPAETMVAMLIEVQQPAISLAQRNSPARSVLVTPTGAAAPIGSGVATPTFVPVGSPSSFQPAPSPSAPVSSAPRLIQASAPASSLPAGSGAATPTVTEPASTRPPTQRVLGGLRDVTNQSPQPAPLLPQLPIGPFSPSQAP